MLLVCVQFVRLACNLQFDSSCRAPSRRLGRRFGLLSSSSFAATSSTGELPMVRESTGEEHAAALARLGQARRPAWSTQLEARNFSIIAAQQCHEALNRLLI